MSRPLLLDDLLHDGFPRVRGMSLRLRPTPSTGSGFPRVSGDEPQPRTTAPDTVAFSPRERG